jgi:hypothetical protein
MDNIPEPKVDADPDPGNAAGGADAVDDGGLTPPVPPEEPLNAQMEDEKVPDEIKTPEEPDSGANVGDPSAEPSA